MSRRIVVDDADPAIKYGSTGWSVANAAQLNTQGNFGPVYRNTSHGTTTNGATLSYSFTGTSVAVYGTIEVKKLADGTFDPIWVCTVDGIAIANPNPTFLFTENNWPLCSQNTIAAGAHTLEITVKTKGQPFYFDNLFYTPVEDPTTVDGAVLEYTNLDAAVSFGSGWQPWGAQNVTQTKGAEVALNFHGTAVTLVAYVPQELAHNATSASYSVDNGPAVLFPLAGLAAGSTSTVYGVPILTVSDLKAATHNLVVTYEGSSAFTPLPVGVFYVTNAVASTSTTGSGSGSQTAGSADTTGSVAPQQTASSSSAPIGAIVGGTVGCIVVLALVAFLTLCWCRKRRRAEDEIVAAAPAQPFMSGPDASAMATAGSSQVRMAPSQQYLQYQYQQGGAVVDPNQPNPFNTPLSSPSDFSLGHDAQPGVPAAAYQYPYSAPMSSDTHSMHSQPYIAALTSQHGHGPYPDAMSMRSNSQRTAPQSQNEHTELAYMRSIRSNPRQSMAQSVAASSVSNSSAGVAGVGVQAGPLPSKLEPMRRPVVVLQQHTDSGLRGADLEGAEVVELPPGYAP